MKLGTVLWLSIKQNLVKLILTKEVVTQHWTRKERRCHEGMREEMVSEEEGGEEMVWGRRQERKWHEGVGRRGDGMRGGGTCSILYILYEAVTHCQSNPYWDLTCLCHKKLEALTYYSLQLLKLEGFSLPCHLSQTVLTSHKYNFLSQTVLTSHKYNFLSQTVLTSHEYNFESQADPTSHKYNFH